MYVTRKELTTIHELIAFVDGQLDSCEDEEYWKGFLRDTIAIKDKMIKQVERQEFNSLVQKKVRQLTKDL